MEFNIIKHMGTISKRTDIKGVEWSKEVNLVSWNRRPPKVDIREWNSDHSRMGKGVTMTEAEAEIVGAILTRSAE